MRKVLAPLAALVLLLVPNPTYAIWVWCTGLAGCGQPPGDVLYITIINLVGLLVTVAAGTAVIFIVWSGLQMVMMLGDEGKVGKAKQTFYYALIGLGLALTSASIVTFVTTEEYYGGGGDLIVSLMQTVVRLIVIIFNTAFLIAIILAGFRMAMASGKQDEFHKATAMIKWAIVGAAIVNLGRAAVTAFVNIGF
jgi:hypothetical protein